MTKKLMIHNNIVYLSYCFATICQNPLYKL